MARLRAENIRSPDTPKSSMKDRLKGIISNARPSLSPLSEKSPKSDVEVLETGFEPMSLPPSARLSLGNDDANCNDQEHSTSKIPRSPLKKRERQLENIGKPQNLDTRLVCGAINADTFSQHVEDERVARKTEEQSSVDLADDLDVQKGEENPMNLGIEEHKQREEKNAKAGSRQLGDFPDSPSLAISLGKRIQSTNTSSSDEGNRIVHKPNSESRRLPK